MENSVERSFIDFADSAAWETWLSNHHDRQQDAWLRIAKKGSGVSSIVISEALDIALCYGWIDSHRKSFDQSYYLQRYSPRRKKSPWSLVNVQKAEELIGTGRMKAPGYAEIRLAQADGRWDAAYESQRTAATPPDLAAELERHEQAKQAFFALDKTARYAVLLPLLKATTPKNRADQLHKAIEKLGAAAFEHQR
ncbi:YdeI/OmpD-associated family protein [Cohnella cholangitidis]|uniref:OmdA domain containing protein n=1 Tax=Cohnella cholangitidis TaxID=2598458 RepID=A0A7G5BYM2_9BACL|nr:YdeI/OmpD-associated family protein [Cohnella cholangitidis]QMV42056.1 OmdA domain containing protein [Cohnella cholangitidis]